MGQYKVPQDVEAEDKLLGPLSLKQFIYVIIALMWGALMWQIFKAFLPLAVILIVPVSGIFLALAFGKREGQTFENYFIALVRFRVMPRKRFWMKDTSTVIIKEPPPALEKSEIIERDPVAVRGQLQQLALVLETQGYLPKDPLIQLPDASSPASQISQRIIAPPSPSPATSALPSVPTDITAPIQAGTSIPTVAGQATNPNQTPATQPPDSVTAKDDMLDITTNERAVAVGEMLENVETKIRAHALEEMQHVMHDKPPAKHPKAKNNPSPTTPTAIEADQNNILTVQQIARRANQEQTIAENQVVKIK